MDSNWHHFVLVGDGANVLPKAIELALVHHYPAFQRTGKRTRLSVVGIDRAEIDDFVFDYQELFDNSFWRVVDLTAASVGIEHHSPRYAGYRKDFVDVEWEFVVGRLSNRLLQEKMRRWSRDDERSLSVLLAYDDKSKTESHAQKLRRRLPAGVKVEVCGVPHAADDELRGLAKYLNYFYQASYEQRHVPTELPEEEVEKAWTAIKDERLRMSNIYNVMSIPVKMEILGHEREDWNTFYALTADEIEMLAAVEHNRWTVERLIQGMRPVTDIERREISEDIRRRLADDEYARRNPLSLKKKYKEERGAHYDICAFSELGVDETGLPVSRYDRDLTAAIPLIVKTYQDRHGNG